MVRVVEDGSVVHRDPGLIVGKPTNRTPTFSNAISYLIGQSLLERPTSIVSKEMLPEIQADPYGYCRPAGLSGLCGGRRQVQAGQSELGRLVLGQPAPRCRSGRWPGAGMPVGGHLPVSASSAVDRVPVDPARIDLP